MLTLHSICGSAPVFVATRTRKSTVYSQRTWLPWQHWWYTILTFLMNLVMIKKWRLAWRAWFWWQTSLFWTHLFNESQFCASLRLSVNFWRVSFRARKLLLPIWKLQETTSFLYFPKRDDFFLWYCLYLAGRVCVFHANLPPICKWTRQCPTTTTTTTVLKRPCATVKCVRCRLLTVNWYT